MKKAAVLLMTAFVLALSGCGLSDPWETWEDEGIQPADRLLPSELKETLCSAAWWKFSYEDEDFYFQFTEDGTVESNSTILRDGTSTTYYLNWDEPYAIELTIVGGGHLGYLSSGKEETFIVTSFDDAEIICTGNDTGTEITFVSATGSDYNALNVWKAEESKRLEVAQGIIDAGMASGAVWASGQFVAHYHIDLSNYKSYFVRFDILENNELSHVEIPASLGLDGTVTLSSAVSVAGQTISVIALDTQDKTVSVGSALAAAVSNSGAWFTGKVSGYGTYEIYRNGGKGAASKAIWDEIASAADYNWGTIEVSDRSGRPFFFCPDGNQTDGQWYVGVYSVDSPYVSATELDRVYLTGGLRSEMPWGGDGKWQNWIMENHSLMFGTYMSGDGIIIVKDGDSGPRKIWLLSPVNENRIMAEKD